MFNNKNEEATAHLAAIIESSEDAIVSKDLHGIIKSWNKGAEKLFGYTAAEVVGKSITIIIPPYLHSEEDEILSRVGRGELISHFETIRQDKWGNLMNISLTVSPIKDKKGNIIGASKIARDISRQKRLEAELQEMNDRKDEFLAILSHELRNPLAAIRGGLELLYRSNYEESLLKQSLGVIERQTDQIVRLVDDLMDITLINQGKINLQKERISLQEVIRMALESCRELNEEKRHQFILTVPDDPIYILGDLSRVAQIVINLVNNAIKYTPAGGEIRITAEQTGEAGSITVQDNGIGIPPGKIDRAFAMFHRIETGTSLAVEGLGVGLGIAKKLAEMHGGKITFAPCEKNPGARFVVSLPLAIPQPPVEKITLKTREAKAQTGSEPLSAGKRILIIDDNKDAAGILEKILSFEGYDVRTAKDGETGIELAANFLPDVCLCDIGLPHMNGYQVAEHLKTITPQTVLIAVSGWGREQDINLSLQAGFRHHVIKSANLDELLNVVKHTVENNSPSAC